MAIKNPLSSHTPEQHRQGKTLIINSLPPLIKSNQLFELRQEIHNHIGKLQSLRKKVELKKLDPINFLEVDQSALDHYIELLQSVDNLMQAEKNCMQIIAKNFYTVDSAQIPKPKPTLKDLVGIKPD